jgi:hypothetical protein
MSKALETADGILSLAVGCSEFLGAVMNLFFCAVCGKTGFLFKIASRVSSSDVPWRR